MKRLLFTFSFMILVVAASLNASVKLGIDNLDARDFEPLQGLRVGLVTNPSGVNHQGKTTIQVLYESPYVNLVALFGPEHGVHGIVKAGEYVATDFDEKLQLPVHSLYGPTRKPTPEMLVDVDIMLFDIQDIGARSYTYISTLGKVMEAASEQGVMVGVLDRPNPLGGNRIEGPRITEKFRSFVSQYDIPYVHGLTIGELALYINKHYLKKPCKLKIFKMSGWSRDMMWRDTKLKWVPTSPNIPREESIAGYVATGLLGELGIANGANDRHPFEIAAVENLDSAEFTRRINALKIRGVRANEYTFNPMQGNWTHITYSGARLHIDPARAGHLLGINYQILDILKDVYPRKNFFERAKKDKILLYDKLNGSDLQRKAWLKGATAEELMASWKRSEDSWVEERKPYLLYK